MDLPPALSLLPNSDARRLLAEVGHAGKPDSLETPASASSKRPARHFDDILGQTLAGPLFATWTPTAPVNPVSGAASTNSATAPIDPNARRDGRRRSRR
jgi:hypothetical protein